ncbi:MAG: ATP-binding protein [Hyphomicrobium sp.]
MTRISLRLRLLFVWAIFIAVTLQVAGIGLRVLFERAITRRTQVELEADLRQLRRGMVVSETGAIRIAREPTDPQFDIVLGGRYWQIAENGKVILRSRSLEDAELPVPGAARVVTENTSTWLVGPQKEKLFAVVRKHILEPAEGRERRELVIVTALDAAEISEDTGKFSSDLFKSLMWLALLLMVGAWAHVTVGLRPLKSLSAKVASVRAGRARRLDGDFPDEVMPLVAETNGLLDAQEEALQEARARAGDLAHGLKTPLAIMAANARTLRRQGSDAGADEIDRQVEAMHRHVERELARARARGAHRLGLAPVDIATLLHNLVPVIDILPRDNALAWTIDVPDELMFGVDADDFNNMAGNLLENAGKWALSRIRVAAEVLPGGVTMVVEDDGPGIPGDQRQRVLRRGERADTSVAGSGLGLAIVSDLVATYGGTFTLSQSILGGLQAVVFLPKHDASA